MDKGNFTDYLEQFNKLYNELLQQGKDVYIFGDDPVWILGLVKKQRDFLEGDLKLTLDDALEIKKMFPNSTKSVEYLIEECQLKPYTKNTQYELLTLDGLESILKGEPFKAYEIHIDML
jgi:hypothetical protein